MAKDTDLLPERQREVLVLIAEGMTTNQIAERLFLSPKTIEYHRAQLADRAGASSIAGLVRFAVRNGLIDP
jgi:DNA-binding NarL/FixJ family response regulator